MEATRESVCSSALELGNAATESEEQRHLLSVTPATFGAMRYTDCTRHLRRDEDSAETWRLRPKETNIEFRAATLRSRGDYREKQALQGVTLRNIRVC